MDRMPSIYVADGSPRMFDDPEWQAQLHTWGQALPRPKAILIFSAHWAQAPLTLGPTETVPLTYDYYGFPERYYEVEYPSPGAPHLAQRLVELLDGIGPIYQDPKRGLDHGAFVPLMFMYPEADVPVLSVSQPTFDPRSLFELGRRLAPLREEGVLVTGAGLLTHGHAPGRGMVAGDPTPSFNREFDAWVADQLDRRDYDALFAYREKAPGVNMALPTVEHFTPLFIATGAAADHMQSLDMPITGWWFGQSKRSIQFN
jgi:4,5-DOPA dioxygenase extradiol